MIVVDEWRSDVYDIVRSIPRGRVATYGLVAMLAGRPRTARFVGRAMSRCDDPSVPCHRVVRANGSMGFLGQRERLRREAVPFRGERVDITRCLWRPRAPSSEASRARRPRARPSYRMRASSSAGSSRSRRTTRNDSPAS
jgi:methylated-DNA-protein-cysteine methyltransferase-like protein